MWSSRGPARGTTAAPPLKIPAGYIINDLAVLGFQPPSFLLYASLYRSKYNVADVLESYRLCSRPPFRAQPTVLEYYSLWLGGVHAAIKPET